MKGKKLKLWEAIKIVDEGGRVMTSGGRIMVQQSNNCLVDDEGYDWSGPFFECLELPPIGKLAPPNIENLANYISDVDKRYGHLCNEMAGRIRVLEAESLVKAYEQSKAADNLRKARNESVAKYGDLLQAERSK